MDTEVMVNHSPGGKSAKNEIFVRWAAVRRVDHGWVNGGQDHFAFRRRLHSGNQDFTRERSTTVGETAVRVSGRCQTGDDRFRDVADLVVEPTSKCHAIVGIDRDRLDG